MTRRNDKRNNRRNRQRNNQLEFSPIGSMLLGALLGKGAEMIAKKVTEKDEETPSIHTEGITDKDIQNINEGNASLSKLYIPNDGTAVEYPVPDNLQFFFDEEGKLMVRKKNAQNNHPQDEKTQEKPITYDDILKELFLDKLTSWVGQSKIYTAMVGWANYDDQNNCTTEAQAKRLLAFNKLQNIAKYLNKGWKPTFGLGTQNWNICKEGDNYLALWGETTENCSVYFKSEEAAYEAVRLMGEDSLNDLFSTDW